MANLLGLRTAKGGLCLDVQAVPGGDLSAHLGFGSPPVWREGVWGPTGQPKTYPHLQCSRWAALSQSGFVPILRQPVIGIYWGAWLHPMGKLGAGYGENRTSRSG